jgi:hypothetical protein
MCRPVEICEKTEDASKNWEMERERERERESSIKQNAFQTSPK